MAKITHKFPNTVCVMGFVDQYKNLGTTKNSGGKAFCYIFNPSLERPIWDLFVPVISFGRSAQEIEKANKQDSLVHVTGRLAMVNDVEGPKLRIIAHQVMLLDEETEGENNDND